MANSKQRRITRKRYISDLNRLFILLESRMQEWKGGEFSKNDVIDEIDRAITGWEEEIKNG